MNFILWVMGKRRKVSVLIAVSGAMVAVLVGIILVRARQSATLEEQLYAAAIRGDITRLKKLLRRGADVNKRLYVMPGDLFRGDTPLHAAAGRGHEDIVAFLLVKGADVDIVGHQGKTPLHAAVEMGHERVAKLLLVYDADVNAHQPGNMGWTPLHWAAYKADIQIIGLLLRKGADINAKDVLGRTALHEAAFRGHKSAVEILLLKGADENLKTDVFNETPLDEAIQEGHRDVIELIREKKRIRIESPEGPRGPPSGGIPRQLEGVELGQDLQEFKREYTAGEVSGVEKKLFDSASAGRAVHRLQRESP